MVNHFDKIAGVYNKVWHFSDHYKEWMIDYIKGLLILHKNDAFVDIGGGTGTFTNLLSVHAGLIKPPVCVEPSIKMCSKVNEDIDIKIINQDANEFINLGMIYDKVLIKEAIHHVKDRYHLWNGLFEQLCNNGRVLVVTRPQYTPMPLFKMAKEAFFRNQPPYEVFVDELRSIGFSVEATTDTYSFSLDKETWNSMIRNRFLSDLAGFSDDEIEIGIQEIDSEFPGDSIIVNDTIIFITARKV